MSQSCVPAYDISDTLPLQQQLGLGSCALCPGRTPLPARVVLEVLATALGRAAFKEC